MAEVETVVAPLEQEPAMDVEAPVDPPAGPPAEEEVNEPAQDPAADVVKAPQVPTRMYFLRMPKPDVSELELKREQISAEVEAYQQACAKTLAAAKLAKEHRLQREEEHKEALEQYNMSKQERTVLLDRLRPLRDVNKQVSEQRRQMGDRKSQLPASTVAELDAKINELEFKQAHEPMDRRSENNLIAEIRKLKKTRPEVMKYEMDNQQALDTRDQIDTFKTSKADLERQMDLVSEEYALAKQQMDERWKAYREACDQNTAVSNEFTRLKALQDEKYKERNEVRDLIRSVQDSFYENRRFSQKVRELLKEGRIEEAAQECNAVTEDHIGKLLSAGDAYSEYVAGWELSRKYAVSQASIDLSGPGKPAKNGKSAKKSAAESSMLANSEAILADIMAEVEGRAPAKSAAEVAAQSVTMPSTAASVPKNGAAAKKRSAPAQIATPAADMVPAEITAAVKASPVKPSTPENGSVLEPPRAAKTRAMPAPVVDDEPFVPPADYIKPAAPELSPAELKEKVRKEQMAKAAEAEERKKQQLERKAKKAQKAKELAKLRAEEEEQKKVAERARIEREAAAQRAASQKKKEAQARKKAVQESKALAKTAAKARSTPAAGRPKSTKVGRGEIKKAFKQYGSYIAVGVITVLIGLVIVMAVTSD